MSTVTITIKTGNAAFQDGPAGLEIARILRAIADNFERTEGNDVKEPRDYNGNVVGSVVVTNEPPAGRAVRNE